VTKAARGTHPLRTGRLDPQLATALADDLAEALPSLQDLEQRLRLRGERVRQAKGVSGPTAAP